MSFHVHCDVPGCASTVPAHVDFYDHRCTSPGGYGFPIEKHWQLLDSVPDGEENESWPQGAAHICPEHDAKFLALVEGVRLLTHSLRMMHGGHDGFGWLWQDARELKRATERFEEACR